ENGVVPVNYGVTKRFIGEKEIMLDEIYANTNGKELNQRLDQHLFAVGYLAKSLVEKLVPDEKNLAKAVYVAGCWHDMGKIDDEFQEELRKSKKNKSYENYPKHHEFSLLLFEMLSESSENLEIVKHAIFWHHAKPLREKDIWDGKIVSIYTKSKKSKEEYVNFKIIIKTMLESINEISNEYDDVNSIDINTLKKVDFNSIKETIRELKLPKYKDYDNENNIVEYSSGIKRNARKNVARTVLTTADQIISSLSSEQLNEHLSERSLDSLVEEVLIKERGLKGHIQECLDGFQKLFKSNERNIDQAEASKKLANKNREIGVLRGPAGCGKTKIALEWALNTNAKKIYWICPRVQVCEGIFDDLCSPNYLPKAQIEIVTGSKKETLKNGKVNETDEGKEFSSDSHIIITTIDQIINAITTHKKVTTLVDFLDAHVVFDEYHEYVNMKGFNFLFAELVACKKMRQEDSDTMPDTLLVSATPNFMFVKDFLGIRGSNDIVGIKSFNKSKYQIKFVEYDEEDKTNPLTEKQEGKGIFVISNKALTAQLSYIKYQEEEKSILFHSSFTKKDKDTLFKRIMSSFGEGGTQDIEVLRSGPVIQSSLNISSKKMISEMNSAENLLQRMGRLDRFGLSDEVNEYIVAISKGVINGVSVGKNSDGSSKWLYKLYSLSSSKAWYEFLKNNLGDKVFILDELYALYDEFYKDEKSKEYLEKDLLRVLEKSVEHLSHTLQDPVAFKNNKEEKNVIKIKKNSLRGDNRFVQMARCTIDSKGVIDILDDYVYDEINDVENVLTLSTDYMIDNKDQDEDLVWEMAKVHAIIKDMDEKMKTKYRKPLFLKEAKDPRTPIYVSYTPSDLKKYNKEAPKAHKNSYYYAEGIGIIQRIKLEKGTENEK
ncbi:MAG TPA: CRISPR-associated endonuclease Cas3'', partial [Arcobacter sp.]|nr:CRISPR-associated endonuclease Cas3'' [Arcobacter sp.]